MTWRQALQRLRRRDRAEDELDAELRDHVEDGNACDAELTRCRESRCRRWRRAVSWQRRARRPDPVEDELDAELRDHVERQVADHIRAGLSPREARRRARLEFGGLDHVKEMCRDEHRARWIEDLGRDLRHALRRQFSERRSGVPLFAVAALAIGIGASTAMFGVLDAVVLQPLPFAHEERLVAGWKTGRTDPTRFIELSYPEFLQWRSQSTGFESLAALPTTVYGYSYVLTGRGDPVSIESARVTGEFFDVLGLGPLLGRTFTATDDRVGAQPLLSHIFSPRAASEDLEGFGNRVVRAA